MALRAMSRPAADRRLLRSVLAASDERRPELTRLIAALRAGIIDRWIRLAPDGKTDAAARAWVWVVFNAQFGLWDLVDGGEIDPEQAVGILIGLITEHFAGPTPRRRRRGPQRRRSSPARSHIRSTVLTVILVWKRMAGRLRLQLSLALSGPENDLALAVCNRQAHLLERRVARRRAILAFDANPDQYIHHEVTT